MANDATRALRALAQCYTSYGPGSSEPKRRLLAALDRGSLRSPRDVRRLHEIACFLRAYPDDEPLLALVEQILARFDARRDLRRHRAALENSGIAGTALRFPFFAPQARRLAQRFPGRLSIDWAGFANRARFERLLPLLPLYAERAAFDDSAVSARSWLRRFQGAESDAAFLVRSWDAFGRDDATRSALYDDLDPLLLLKPGNDGPARTRERFPGLPVAYQTRALSRERPALRDALRVPPSSVRALVGREAQAAIDLARDAMVPRARDLEVFEYGNPEDVRLVDAGGGFCLACIGTLPERRSLLEAVYAFLMLKNGVPVGYALCSALFHSSEVAHNVFEPFRGGETAWMFGRLLATIRHLFGSEAFAIDPYQLGHGNDEGLRSGAFWFYQKLGFRPRAREVAAELDRELARLGRQPRRRSTRATLRALSRAYLFWPATLRRSDVLGVLSPSNVALQVSHELVSQLGADRRYWAASALRRAADRLGVTAAELRGFTRTERQAWERWAPLVVALPRVEAWSRAQKRALVAVVRAKGATRESDFVALFDQHRPLRDAVRRLALRPPA